MIWVYLLLGSFPWCLGLWKSFGRNFRNFRAWAMAHNGRGLYWLLWMVWPVLFFTPARNIIATYPLPALPALAILLVELNGHRRAPGVVHGRGVQPLPLLPTAATMLLTTAAILVSLFLPQFSPKRSERMLVQRFEKERAPGDRLVYYGPRKYSAEFYTEGGVDHTTSASTLEQRLDAPGRTFLAMPSYWQAMIPPPLLRRLRPVATWGPGPSLYVERTDMPDMTGIDPSKTPPIGN